MTVQEMIYKRERDTLSPSAFLTENSRGRLQPISDCVNRSDFQRDRDRIIHSKAFRRLMHKTQVFISPEADHYRTRLTHTLEVTQVARTIARALRLNEDLCEAIALGHDLGHTPFGHSGERLLRRVYDSSFTHYAQSLRVCDILEKLNLTYEVRDGILHHTIGGASTLEGEIIRAADHIAYINHDIDDACRAGILSPEEIPGDICDILGETHGERIDTMVQSIIEATEKCGEKRLCMGAEVEDATRRLHGFLFERVYLNPAAKGEEIKAERMLEVMYEYFISNYENMPTEYRLIALGESIPRAVCDYISGMTDRYAVSVFKKIFEPQVWK